MHFNTRLSRLLPVALTACVLSSVAQQAVADTELIGADQGKLHLTAGFNDVEGAGGAGLVPLSFITGYGSSDSWGGNAHVTTVHLNDDRNWTSIKRICLTLCWAVGPEEVTR